MAAFQRKSKVATVWLNETLSRSELEYNSPFPSGTSEYEDDIVYYRKIGLSWTLTSYMYTFVKGVPFDMTTGTSIHWAVGVTVWKTWLIIRSMAFMSRLYRSCCSNIWNKMSFMTTSRYVWDFDAFSPD